MKEEWNYQNSEIQLLKIFLNIETNKNNKIKIEKKIGLYISYFKTYYIKWNF